MSVIAGAAAVPHALNVRPTAAAAAVLCGLVITEIVGLPGMLLPGGTMTLLAFLSDSAVIGWWRRRPGRGRDRPAARQGRAAGWLTAAMPSLAGAAQMPYRGFTLRLLALRLPSLAGLLAAGRWPRTRWRLSAGSPGSRAWPPAPPQPQPLPC